MSYCHYRQNIIYVPEEIHLTIALCCFELIFDDMQATASDEVGVLYG